MYYIIVYIYIYTDTHVHCIDKLYCTYTKYKIPYYVFNRVFIST